jgi:hypothetical protein
LVSSLAWRIIEKQSNQLLLQGLKDKGPAEQQKNGANKEVKNSNGAQRCRQGLRSQPYGKHNR